MKHLKSITLAIAVFMAPAQAQAALDAGAAGPGWLVPDRDAAALAGMEVRGLEPGMVWPWEDPQTKYNPGGRRDPFLPFRGSVVGPGPDMPGWEEVRLVGIVRRLEGGDLALFAGGDEDTGYLMGEGMRFRNGGIREIDARNGVVVIERTGPSGLPEQIDIRLHPLEQETQ